MMSPTGIDKLSRWRHGNRIAALHEAHKRRTPKHDGLWQIMRRKRSKQASIAPANHMARMAGERQEQIDENPVFGSWRLQAQTIDREQSDRGYPSGRAADPAAIYMTATEITPASNKMHSPGGAIHIRAVTPFLRMPARLEV